MKLSNNQCYYSNAHLADVFQKWHGLKPFISTSTNYIIKIIYNIINYKKIPK